MKPKIKKGITIATLICVIVFVTIVFFKFYFVFGDGIKNGELNYLDHKGYIFKTFDGKLTQTGLRSPSTGIIMIHEFQFTVVDKTVADSLMRCGGKEVELHYKEYLGALPWRGVNKFIVDKIVSVK
jgi:hypothetical protein